jgi:transposase
MNQLKMDIQLAISSLSRNGWSQRRIARELGIDRETVARYRKLSRQTQAPNPAIPPAGSEPLPAANPAISPAGSRSGRVSHCEPYRAAIEAGLERGLSAQRIYQDLAAEQQFSASYDSVKRFVRQLEQSNPLPFRRMETEPGEEAQVDFGQGAWVVEPDGRRRRPYVLRVVLSHSRKGYTEAFWRQTTENFIRGLENAFRHFGGVVATLIPDYVPCHIIDVLFPPAICALALSEPQKPGKMWGCWLHIVQRFFSHFISSASSCQMTLRGPASEEAEAGGWHACSAASFMRRLISA